MTAAAGERAAVLALLGLGWLTGLTGCGSAASPGDGDRAATTDMVDEVAAHGGHVCPAALPATSPEPSPERPAASAPSLTSIDRAWVCQYAVGPTSSGTLSSGWHLVGRPYPVAEDRFRGFEESLARLEPAADDRACPSDLGRRWMLVYVHGSDLTGVVVENYGCHDVTLTDEPFTTAPGEGSQPGVVRGVLTGPPDLLAQLEESSPAS